VDLNYSKESIAATAPVEKRSLFRRTVELAPKAGALGIGLALALPMVEIASGSEEAHADEITYCNVYDTVQNICLEWVTITVTNPHNTTPPNTTPPSGGGGGSTGGGTTQTTIPESQRNLDGDLWKNGEDNCDTIPNDDQANFDGDADGDVCDGDADNDFLVDAYDPDRFNPDVDGDGFVDGDPTELEDKAGDGTQDLLQSRIDVDGDGYSAETGDTDETNPCILSDQAANCDADGDGIFGTADGNPKVPFEDIDGDRLDDTAPASSGGDTNLTDGPKADIDKDGIPNDTDKQSQKPKAGEEVDTNGVITVVEDSAVESSTTVTTTKAATATAPEVTDDTTDETTGNTENDNSVGGATGEDDPKSGIGAGLLLGGGVLTLSLLTGRVLVVGAKRRKNTGKPKNPYGPQKPSTPVMQPTFPRISNKK